MSDKKQFAIVMIVSAIFVLWIIYSSLEIVFINDELKTDPVLESYPYHFRVFRKEGRIAVMGTLRSSEFSLPSALRLLYPSLTNETDTSRSIKTAEQQFARMQARAQEVALKHEAFDFIRWELDENWIRVNKLTVIPEEKQ